MSMDTHANGNGEAGAAGSWLTYDQLAAIRGIDRAAAVKLALRHGWPKERDRSRTMHVQVPSDWLARVPVQSAFEATARTGQSPVAEGHAEHTRVVERSMWREQLAQERDRADAAEREQDRLLAMIDNLERRIAAAETRAEHAEQALTAERARADALAEGLREISRLLDVASARRAHDGS